MKAHASPYSRPPIHKPAADLRKRMDLRSPGGLGQAPQTALTLCSQPVDKVVERQFLERKP